jgi:hypothetical protein
VALSLIPDYLRGGVLADLGLAELYRCREESGWQERCMELAGRHPDASEFIQLRAIAVLSLSIDVGNAQVGGISPVSSDKIFQIAGEMKELTERLLGFGFAHEHDLFAYLNNTAALLRISGRDADVIELLSRGRHVVARHPALRRMLILSLMATSRHDEAMAELQSDTSPENLLLRADLAGMTDPANGLAIAQQITPADLPAGMAATYWQLVAELAIRSKELGPLDGALGLLRKAAPASPVADALALRGERLRGLTQDEFQERFRSLAHCVSEDVPLPERLLLAVELRNAGSPDEASRLLDGRLDLGRVTPALVLYLQTLGEARRDDVFQQVLTTAATEVREYPTVLWFTAAQAWNAGDLPSAETAINMLIAREPKNIQGRLFRLEIWVRTDRTEQIRTDLQEHVEDLDLPTTEVGFKLARLLNHFGFHERAARYAYRLFLANRQNPLAWMTLNALVLGESPARSSSSFEVTTVGPDVAVDLTYDDGRKQFFIVEPDPRLCNLDEDSWEPRHPLVQAVTGLGTGDRFTAPQGGAGVITELRHKLVARFHYVLQNFEARFPNARGFQSFSVAPEDPNWLDQIRGVLRERSDWVRQEQQSYTSGFWPLGLLAARLHRDPIETAEGLVAQGIRLKVALGNEAEREAAEVAIARNQVRGCVMDQLSFWTAWRCGILDVVVDTCGPVHVAQKVLDRLMERRQILRRDAEQGAKTAHYAGGRIVITETPPDIVQELLRDLDSAIAWLKDQGTITPVVMQDDLPKPIREHVSLGLSDIFDNLVVAWHGNLLFVCDDLGIRQLAAAAGFQNTCWTHAVLLAARAKRHLDHERYVPMTALLIGAGHNYIGINGNDLALALWLDFQVHGAPGPMFEALASAIGGRDAEPRSHVSQVTGFLRQIWPVWPAWGAWSGDANLSRWGTEATERGRKVATSLLLRQLISGRHGDYRAMLQAVLAKMGDRPEFMAFFEVWRRGHFLVDQLGTGRS